MKELYVQSYFRESNQHSKMTNNLPWCTLNNKIIFDAICKEFADCAIFLLLRAHFGRSNVFC